MVDDLEQVNHLEIRVDTREQVLSQLGERLPSLRELKLSESVLSSVRDLGTRLRNLQVLWVARCGLPDLDGIAALDGLRELYAAFNDIADLSPLAMHDRLEVVDVDSNAVADPDQVAQLATCPRLHTLTLEANPICAHPHYRRLVCHNVRSLEWLDDQPVSSMDRLPVRGAAWQRASVAPPPHAPVPPAACSLPATRAVRLAGRRGRGHGTHHRGARLRRRLKTRKSLPLTLRKA